MSIETDDNMAEVPPHDRVCSYVGCVADEPDDFVLRELRGVDYVGVYCSKHDPLDDPDGHDMWEEYNG